jgi:YD repeat-containing protein
MKALQNAPARGRPSVVGFVGVLAGLSILLSTANAVVISYSYDSAGRLTTANYGGLSSTTYSYDANGNLLSRANSESIFVPLAGNYAGLIAANPASNEGAGVITLSVTSTGGFTGKLSLAGKSFKIHGVFDSNGNAELDLPVTPPVHLSLHIDAATREITGNLSGGVIAAVTAFPAVFGKKNPAPGGAVGKFTALFVATENATTTPKGTGFGTVAIGATGSVKLAGALADGTKISQGTTLVIDAGWPLFVELYKKGGFVSGFVEYRPSPGVGDFAAMLDWQKPTTTKLPYTAPFETQVELSAARYSPPAKGERVLELADTSPNGEFLAPGIDRQFTLDAKNRIIVETANPENLALKLNTKSGAVSGSLQLGGKSRKLSGILQLEQNIGAGFFFSDTESLPFTLGEN